jgi:hypothetical protein
VDIPQLFNPSISYRKFGLFPLWNHYIGSGDLRTDEWVSIPSLHGELYEPWILRRWYMVS